MAFLDRHAVQACHDCGHNLHCLSGMFRKHYPHASICPMCGLVRFAEKKVESDDDCVKPYVRCHELQHNVRKRGLWVAEANRREKTGLSSRETYFTIDPKPYSGFYPTSLYLCDTCWAEYTPRREVSLYEILKDGP